MTRKQSVAYFVLVLVGLGMTVAFGAWWFQIGHVPGNFHGRAHIVDLILFLAVSYVIWHQIIMEVLLWAIASHIKPHIAVLASPGMRVAFLTTFVPSSESLELLEKTLPAMAATDYPHDTWLLDEGCSAEAQALCRRYGIGYFSRKGVSYYNTAEGKFATKTKGGNHNSWYDWFADSYDVVAQIDTDFIPSPRFLTETLGYFSDPQVAFVGTPQVYGNTKDNFIARGAAEQTYTFYGPLLRGLFGMDTTLLIGANHVIRVAALKDIDFYKAHITEDLLTGMELHARGWKSVYVPEVLAVGEGPNTWAAYFSQQMRWAYGCIDVLFRHSPRLLRKMGLRRATYYFWLQQHYFTGLAMLVGVALSTLYFTDGVTSTSMALGKLLMWYLPVVAWQEVLRRWLQRFNIRPNAEKGWLWPGRVISVAAWPIYAIAAVSVVLRKRLSYKVTPKGKSGNAHISHRVFLPHLLIGLVSAADLVVSLATHREAAVMEFWAALSTMAMFGLIGSEVIATWSARLHEDTQAIRKTVDTVAGYYFKPAYADSGDYDRDLLPDAPTDVEKYAYARRDMKLLIYATLISFPLLMASMFRLIYGNPFLDPLFLLWGFSLIYFAVSQRVNFFSPDFDLGAHQNLLANWQPEHYPSIDVFLPVCGEPLDVLQNSWDGVKRMQANYPGTVKVYCLDDGDDPDVKLMSWRYGFFYLVRPNRGWYKKAGNLRYGFEHSDGEFIIIYDADFRPRADFIQELLPYMSADETLGIVQSPQYFNVKPNQNWLERGAGEVQEFFYRGVQVSRQHLGAAICVGSNAIYRRAALNTIGGTALYQHSEDVRTGFGIRQHGWKLRYVPINLATGLCPADLGSFFRQQYRWGTGGMSLFTDRDFWKAKMKLKSRLCYLSGFLYYWHTAFYAVFTPVLPVIMLLVLPQEVRVVNMVFLLPAMVYNYIIFPRWHKAHYGPETWSVRNIYAWAHLFAIVDLLILKKPLEWRPTGTGGGKSQQYQNFRACVVIFNVIPGLIWIAAATWQFAGGYGPNWNFFPILLSGIFYEYYVSRIAVYRTVRAIDTVPSIEPYLYNRPLGAASI